MKTTITKLGELILELPNGTNVCYYKEYGRYIVTFHEYKRPKRCYTHDKDLAIRVAKALGRHYTIREQEAYSLERGLDP